MNGEREWKEELMDGSIDVGKGGRHRKDPSINQYIHR